MKDEFVGRKTELALLDRLWEGERAQFLVLYGRRRVGKTAMLIHWIRQSGRRVLYWVASSDSALSQLRSFSQAVYNFANPQAPAPESFTYASWEQAWQEAARLAVNERLALFIDEFTYLLEVTPGIAGQLQNFWDRFFRETNLFLCLSGSHLGMMKREFLSYQAPLYGRATAQLYLQPLPFGLTHKFFPKYSAVDRVAVYAIFGGIPAYWERIESHKSVSQNIKAQLLTTNNLMQSEPRLLLQDFISEPHNYLAVLTALANGARTPKDIAGFTGLPNIQVPKYLSVMSEAGFVERRIPVIGASTSRSGRHHIMDPYLRFYFRFLARRQGQLALGVQDQALAEISKHMIDFIGTHTWEELCREWVLCASQGGVFPQEGGGLPFLPDQVGSAWNNSTQIDVAGINSMQKTLILGECKWTLSPADRSVLVELVEEKTKNIIPEQGYWRVYILGFSRSGWTDGALAYQREINKRQPSGRNWNITGLRLLDLNQVDRDLERWSDNGEAESGEINV
jgi:AAA+ ATPase superfamily predicted ATPase